MFLGSVSVFLLFPEHVFFSFSSSLACSLGCCFAQPPRASNENAALPVATIACWLTGYCRSVVRRLDDGFGRKSRIAAKISKVLNCGIIM